jgi:hypothetical protein
MKYFHLTVPNQEDCVRKLQSIRTSDGMFLVVLASDKKKNITKLVRREPRHIWHAQTSHGERWAEWRDGVGWTIWKWEPR